MNGTSVFRAILCIRGGVFIALIIILNLSLWSYKLLLILSARVIIIRPCIYTTIAVTSFNASGILSSNKRLGLSCWLSKWMLLINFHLINLVNSFPYSGDVLKLSSKLPRALSWWQVPLGHWNEFLVPLIVLIVDIYCLLILSGSKRHTIISSKRAISMLWLNCKVHYFKFKIKSLIFFAFK